MKPKLLLPVMAALLVLTACHKKKSDPGMETLPVEVATPMIDSVTLYKTYPGFLSAANVVDVVCQVNGKILTKNYTSGAYVQKGQVLFTIDPTLYRDQVREAESSLSTAKASYEFYSKQYAAMQKALQADAVSQMDVIQAKSNMEKAEAAIAQSTAALNTARTNLGYCSVRAPMSGYITSPTLDPGNFVAGAGAPVKLATIYDDSAMKAVFSIEDGQYEQMLAGGAEGKLQIPLTFSSPLPHEYYATLSYVDVTVDKQTGTLTLKGDVANPYHELKNDMYLTASLPYGTNPQAMLVRDASVSSDQAGSYVYVVNDSNKVVYTPIEAGPVYHDSLRVVTKGLTPQSRYVTSALLKVRDGMTVKPVVSDK